MFHRSLCFFTLLLLSCTIIQDSDITSQEELDALQLKSVTIRQESAGAQTPLVATVTSTQLVSATVPDGGKLAKIIWMDWPALVGKVKLKGGHTQAFKTYTSYLESGHPYTFYLFNSDSVLLELYRFRYDNTGRLNKIISYVPAILGNPPSSNDTLIYSSTHPTEIERIDRRSSNSANVGTFTFTGGGAMYGTHWSFEFKGSRYTKACQGSGCQEYFGGNYHATPPGSGGGQPVGVLNWFSLPKAFLTIADMNGPLDNFGCSTCKRHIDTFYFHPLMIIKDQITIRNNKAGPPTLNMGDALLFIYMVDWWKPVTNVESGVDEQVKFSFGYE